MSLGVWTRRVIKEGLMLEKTKRTMVFGIGFLALLVLFNLSNLAAADSIVGTWNYSTSGHWSRGPVPAGKPSQGTLVITQSGNEFKMEFRSGMVFSPPELKYFTGKKTGKDYIFSNSAKVDNEGGVAKNSCTLKMLGNNHFAGKSSSEYSQGPIKFSWGFDIELKK
jgi:hypothetical protein